MTPTARHRSGAARPPRRAEFDDAERHSRRVLLLKWLLPASATGLFVLFVIWGRLAQPALPIAVTVDDSAIADGKLVMVNPHLGGVNKDNERYELTASRAVQDISATDIIQLETIDADIPVERGARARVVTERGVYDRAAGTMSIDTPVTATTTDGMTARLQSARIDMQAGKLDTDHPVDIKTPSAHITAQSMSVDDHGKTIVFDRRVRLTIDPSKVRTPDNEGAANAQN